MTYINTYELIKNLLNGGKIDERQLLSTVDRQKIIDVFSKYNNNFQTLKGIIITNKPIEEEKWSKIPHKDKERILNINSNLKKTPEKVIDELVDYKKKYPTVPTIYNYLTIAYQRTKQSEKYVNILFETYEKFPNYIFGKIALCDYYLNNDDISKVPFLLENKFEISQHFPPETKEFHISTVRNFYFIVGRYFAKVGKIEMAYKSYFLLNDMDKNHEMTESLGQSIIFYEINQFKKDFEKNKSLKSRVKTR